MFRKRRQPTPGFRLPPPYSPVTGQFAPVARKVERTRVAMMQVIEEDTHDNYVVCRGYDPEARVFLNTVNVAKPYSLRGTFPYNVAQVFGAVKAQMIIGETPGVASVTTGQPADLDEVVEILTDDGDRPIAWLDIEGRIPPPICGTLDGDLNAGGSATLSIYTLAADKTNWVTDSVDSGSNATVYGPCALRTGKLSSGDWAEAYWESGNGRGTPRYVVRIAEC